MDAICFGAVCLFGMRCPLSERLKYGAIIYIVLYEVSTLLHFPWQFDIAPLAKQSGPPLIK
jgi:hypothetical protein